MITQSTAVFEEMCDSIPIHQAHHARAPHFTHSKWLPWPHPKLSTLKSNPRINFAFYITFQKCFDVTHALFCFECRPFLKLSFNVLLPFRTSIRLNRIEASIGRSDGDNQAQFKCGSRSTQSDGTGHRKDGRRWRHERRFSDSQNTTLDVAAEVRSDHDRLQSNSGGLSRTMQSSYSASTRNRYIFVFPAP